MHCMRVPFGPQHPALPEPVHFTLKVEGEEVKGIDMSLGYNHRGIEKGFQQRDVLKDIYLAERVCGLCGHSHSSCFVKGVEDVLGIKAPERANYIRTLIFELSRIHSHMLFLAMTAYELGYDTLFQIIFKDREYCMELLEEITGNRVHYVINTFGGVRRDFKVNPKMREKLEILKKRIKYHEKAFNSEKSIVKRTKGKAVLTHKDVIELGVVGPNARASGVSMDMRRDEPYFSYDDIKFKVITKNRGDILSRINIRLEEVYESLKMIDQLIEKMPSGKIRIPVNLGGIQDKEVVSRVEAPRGELVYYIRTSKGKTFPERVKIRTPTYATMTAMEKLLTGLQIADVPIAIMSIDPCLSCTDRMTILDLKTGNKKIVSGDDLRHGNY